MPGYNQTEPSFSSEVITSFGLDQNKKRASSFAFTSKQPPVHAKAYKFDASFEFDFIQLPAARATDVRSIASGISIENFILLVEAEPRVCFLGVKRARRQNDVGGNPPLIILPIRNDLDLERTVRSIRKFPFTADELTVHFSLASLYEELRVGKGDDFTDRGLFSEWYLKNRLFKTIQEHGRNIQKEAETLFANLGAEDLSGVEPRKMLSLLGFEIVVNHESSDKTVMEYGLKIQGNLTKTLAILVQGKDSTGVDSLDIRTAQNVAPSYLAVSSLRSNDWVILTNGRIWRLYSRSAPSSSTNYFEIDLEGVSVETDRRLYYFVSLFSSSSFIAQKNGFNELEITFNGSQEYAHDIEEDLRSKVFDGQLFLNLVRGVLDHNSRRKYSDQELSRAKITSLKFLYRLLFILYAESRNLLPVADSKYSPISFKHLHERLSALESDAEGTNVWKSLRTLFRAINKGSSENNVPEYDGALFEEDGDLDGLTIKNKFLAKALHDLVEMDSKGIDYQNLGVRHLGSLYEALLQYSVRQAEKEMIIFKREIIEAEYAKDLKAKPENFIPRGDLYLSAAGQGRKLTGSYYTPDEIVSFLVKEGLEPHLSARKERFVEALRKLRKLDSSDKSEQDKLEKACDDQLLDIRVVDPAMGSGHFLVEAVDEISRWIIDVLKEFPDAPLALRMKHDRDEIIQEQRKRGITLDTSLLTDVLILKRMVMKRCVYGVDLNFLAVELAKLSLWLDSFTIGTPLTFLDHHIRWGDSLIGLWLESMSRRAGTETLENWMDVVSLTGAGLVESVSMPADITKMQVEQSRRAYFESRKRMYPYETVLDIMTSCLIDEAMEKKVPRNLPLVEKTARELEESKIKKKPGWWDGVQVATEFAKSFHAFHWEIEFPDAYVGQESHRGFDLIITNPPWEGVKPDDDDFFEVYYPKFRNLAPKSEKAKKIKSLLKDNEIKEAYEKYLQLIDSRASFYKGSGLYTKQGSGDENFWKLFVERSLSLLAHEGTLAIVLDSGIVIHEGAKELRQALFENTIRFMYEFENLQRIFPDVHPQDKFVLLVVDKSAPTASFPVAFYLHDLAALSGDREQDKFIEMPLKLIEKCAPDSLSIPEVRSKEELNLFTKLYGAYPLLSDETKGWAVSFVRDLDMTNDNKLFKEEGKGWPLFEGKHFHQFIPSFTKTRFVVEEQEGLVGTSKHKEYGPLNKVIHKGPRLAYRSTGNSTNVRSMIACILPPRSFTSNSAIVVVPRIGDVIPTDKQYLTTIGYLNGLMNSFVFDFIVRKRITRNLNFFYIYQTPVPARIDDTVSKEISDLASTLNYTDERYSEFAAVLGLKAEPLSMKDRIQLTAKLNILVARSYNLTAPELNCILDTFDVCEEDKELEKMEKVEVWDEELIRKLNGEVKRCIVAKIHELELLVN